MAISFAETLRKYVVLWAFVSMVYLILSLLAEPVSGKLVIESGLIGLGITVLVGFSVQGKKKVVKNSAMILTLVLVAYFIIFLFSRN